MTGDLREQPLTWLETEVGFSSGRLDVMETGQQVRKLKGYPFDGEVRAAFLTTRGSLRYVVESTTLPGLLHIFAPEQIEVRRVDRRCDGGFVGAAGECVACDAEQGVACRKPRAP